MGLAWDGRYLWQVDNGADRIHQIDPDTGTSIRDFATPGFSPLGLTWDGRTLWHTDDNSDLIYQIDPISGVVIRTLAGPAASTRGIIWDGRMLWVSDTGTSLAYQIDPATGTVQRSIALPGNGTRDLAWDGASLWNCDIATDRIYQIDPVTGTVKRSFPAPSDSPRGITWDGRTLWNSDRDSDLIYQLSVVPGASYADRILATGPIAYWPQWETAGTISFDISGHSPLSEQDGTYTGVTLAQPGIGDGRTSGRYDGGLDYDNIYSVSLNAAFNGQLATLMVWVRVSGAGVWTDGAARKIIYFRVDANNQLFLQKPAANNQLDGTYIAGGVTKVVISAAFAGRTDWIPVAITVDRSADEMITYVDGVQIGAIQNGLGIWAGNLDATRVLIGALHPAPLQVWDGYLAHGAVWDRALSPAEVLSLGVL